MAIVMHNRRPGRRRRAGYRPRVALASLGGLGDGTGINFLDQNLSTIRDQVAFTTTAAKITAACSIIGALASIVLVIRSVR